jgi:hypothetical protein
LAVAALSAVGVAPAAAQGIPLAGEYRCVQHCRGPGMAFIAQNAWQLNLVNEAGQPSRAWIDYAGHIWAEYWQLGAVYSPDGLILFDDGTAWQRIIPTPPGPPPPAPLPYSGRRG